jgi:hypothetical protein
MDNIRSLVPQDKHDIEYAERAIKAGYPAVEPILPELLQWLQDINYPVAQVLAPFLASIGKPLIPHIRKVFAADDELWKRWIMDYIMSESREIAEAFRPELQGMAYFPTESEIETGLEEEARFILKQFSWEVS